MRMIFFVVKGFGRFPIDMLRYDECFPRTSEDGIKIEHAVTGELRKWEISMCSNRRCTPTVDRWSSFLTKVIEIDGKRQEGGAT